METEAEAGRRQPQAQGCLEPPEAGRGRKDPPLGLRRERGPAHTLILDFWPPDCEWICLCCLNHPVCCGGPRKCTCGVI